MGQLSNFLQKYQALLVRDIIAVAQPGPEAPRPEIMNFSLSMDAFNHSWAYLARPYSILSRAFKVSNESQSSFSLPKMTQFLCILFWGALPENTKLVIKNHRSQSKFSPQGPQLGSAPGSCYVEQLWGQIFAWTRPSCKGVFGGSSHAADLSYPEGERQKVLPPRFSP